jgi:hypothetical protein
MGNAISAAVGMVSFLNPWPGASATVAVHSGVRIRDLQLLATAAGVFISVGFIYRHLHRGASNRRLPEIVPFMLCVCAGVLHFLLFVGASAASGGADVDHGAEARALGLAALRVLPAAATVTFFLGTMLIFAARISAGGEEPVQAPVGLRLLSRMALAAAAALVCMMAVAVYGAYWSVGSSQTSPQRPAGVACRMRRLRDLDCEFLVQLEAGGRDPRTVILLGAAGAVPVRTEESIISPC